MTDKIRVREHDRKLPEKKQSKTKTEPVTRAPTQGVEIIGGGPGNPKVKGVEIHSARRTK